jgi:hypothetical protein
MKMKKIFYTLVITTALAAASLFTACQSSPSTPAEEAAQAKVDTAKSELREAQKAATAEEWEAFKTESVEKIRINELSIADFKEKMRTSESQFDALYVEKIDKLEKQNKKLKAKIENYENFENRKNNWASFKSEFNHDMDELGQALKDLTVDNKK